MAAMAAAAGGCGLVSSDVTNFDLTLPEKKFTIDASGWDVQQTDADKFTAISCGSNPSVCSSAVSQACTSGCSGTCNTTKSTCDLSLDVALSQPVNLMMDKPELKSINDEPVIKVTIDSVTYDVASNSLNVATPVINVYVGATTVLKPNDPANPGTLIGTIPPIPAGQTTTGQTLMFTPTGKAELIKFMSSFKTPFNVLVGSSLLITAGQPVPTGKLEAVVHIKGHAGV
ncbi:MAG: hypothetical protein E6J90_13085 [Deltaproteobacteria bacterium]|nr:MAG: hypothetical protein E6J91_36185 [Deltaproteobacteria bacterium]TMQ22104.1 MAG: hypothetical protein E6J90_13085 [Deltaproteobacteria bacterium]